MSEPELNSWLDRFDIKPAKRIGLQDVRSKAEVNPRWFIEGRLYIATKKRHDSLLKFNHSQNEVWQGTEKQPGIEYKLAHSIPIREVILKSRQVGISTQLSGYAFTRWWAERNFNALIIAHLKEVTSNLFKKHKKFYASLPRELLIPLERSNKQELIQDMAYGGSQLFLQTAGTPHAARSQTIHFVHGSEAAFYPDLDELKTALEASVPDDPGTAIFWESTAFGAGTPFHELWKAALEGESLYTARFLEWFKDPECNLREPFESELVRDTYLERVYAKHPQLKDRREHFGLTAEQICWYFQTCVNKYKGDWLKMQQEYPCDAEEAFLSTGATIIPLDIIQQYRDKARDGIMYEITDLTSDHNTWVQDNGLQRDKHSYLEVWSLPKAGRHYLIAIDTASGTAADYSCLMVFDIATQNLCAELHGKIEPKRLAQLAMRVGTAYNNAVLVPETNGLGLATLSHLEDKYFHIYRRRRRGSLEGTVMTDKLGWDTSPDMRWVILASLRRMMMDRLADDDTPEQFIPCKALISEMFTFIQPPQADSKPVAEKGCHDDRVLCAAIGAYCCLEELQMRPDILPTIQNSSIGDNRFVFANGEMNVEKLQDMINDPNWTGVGEYVPATTQITGPFCPDVQFCDDDIYEME